MNHAPRRRRFNSRLTLSLLLAARTFAAREAAAHEGHDTVEEPVAAAKFPPGVILPVVEGPKPWSDKPVLSDPDRFQIAIMTDNTGGHRPGVWMEGVRRVNLMRPDFVVSVGDLIEGYTEDVAEIETQWKEFLGFIDQLEMRFFFVPGNHDLSNPTMHRIWREHFGREWYSFDYRGVHFVALSSEDPEDRIGPEQLAWLKTDLEAHRDARWTLFFLHKPLWLYAERDLKAGNPDSTNWKELEKLVLGRPHTVFAGHVHHYVQYDRNGTQYYHLATTGGGSQLRGIPYGEFDHVTWLTMEADGPRVAHLLLDGVLAPNAVTEPGIARFRDFLAKSRVEIAPILIHAAEGFTEGRIDLRLVNEFDKPVELTARIEGLPLRGLTLDPEALHLEAAAQATRDLAVNVRFAEPIAFDRLAQTTLVARVRTKGEEPPLAAELSLPVIIDARYDCPPHDAAAATDSATKLPHTTGDRPLLLEGADLWTGPNDARVDFAIGHAGAQLHLTARIADDRVLAGADALEVYVDPRPFDERSRTPEMGSSLFRLRAVVPPSDGETPVEARVGDTLLKDYARATVRRRVGGYDVDLTTPVEFLHRRQRGDWQTFQLTLVQHDVDEPSGQASRVVWRYAPAPGERNAGFGQFMKSEK
jgi:Calcineurin-like phosphoesterase